ncbi:aminoglycoside phosphotransferase family protein [Streptomyces sparsogenes]|uniref:aminoglycoside phosphotransferase family protein n=1 Tax=Streptomyces sparsogenes TaxID=67365 RepID=UPI003316C453
MGIPVDVISLYRKACEHDTALSGYYNRNVRVESDDGPVMVRVPSAGAETMDLAIWPEAALLDAIGPHVPSAPRLMHANIDPPFQIQEFVEGALLDDAHPAGAVLPDAVLDDIAAFFSQLLAVPVDELPATPSDWPKDGDTASFAELLLRLVRSIRVRGDQSTARLYRDLGVPEDPCGLLARRVTGLSARPFRLLHADIHRKNIILGADRTVFLDWELALWGDPVYDLADHLHKMSYLPAEDERITAAWARVAPPECRAGWEEDLRFYRAYERMKSAVVDTVRWARLIASAAEPQERRAYAVELADKLDAARPCWTPASDTVLTPDDIERAVDRWSATGGTG